MRNRSKNVYKLIFLTMLLLMVGLFILPQETLAAYELEITYNDKDDNYYYIEDGTFRKGDVENPLYIDICYDRVIIDYTAADDFNYPFYFKIINKKKVGDPNYEDLAYAKYLVEEKTKEKKFVMDRIDMKAEGIGKSDWYQVTPDTEGTGTSYLQPGAVYYDDSDAITMNIEPLYAFSYHILLSQKIENVKSGSLLNNITNVFMDLFGDYADWVFEQRMGNAFVDNSSLSGTLVSYPSAFVFAITGVSGDGVTDDGKTIELKDLFKFSNKQVHGDTGSQRCCYNGKREKKRCGYIF